MAAYAALTSLVTTITIDQNPNFFPPSATKLLESLRQTALFLQQFLEGDCNNGATHLEARIADAAHAAEDAIESNIADQILSGSTVQNQNGSDLLCPDLQKAIEAMDSIKFEAIQIKNEEANVSHLQVPKTPIPSASRPIEKTNRMVAFEDEKLQIMAELASSNPSRQVISIVGMGGIGKTTLARNVYDDKLIVEYFHVSAWVTVSQGYDLGEILTEVLSSLTNQERNKNVATDYNYLGEKVHKSLSGKRYLIVLDDIWSLECWYSLRRFFPDNDNGSRILVTTRMSNLANEICSFNLVMKFLDENVSWDLFCKEVFLQESCPLEFKEIGMKIARNCKGLPLALVVIGGLLKKSTMGLEQWERVARDVGAAISSDPDDPSMEILSSSYAYLPVHLKPCFLYMGMFREDQEISVSELSKLWISEGFLKPVIGKSFEEIARDSIKELVERNLILVDKIGSSGRIKSCKMHDLMRDLSLREALKEKFLFMVRGQNRDISHVANAQRRIVFYQSSLTKDECHKIFDSLLSSSPRARTLICHDVITLPAIVPILLRVLKVVRRYPYGEFIPGFAFQSVNLRYLDVSDDYWDRMSDFLDKIRNIQSIEVHGPRGPTLAPCHLWDRRQLRHVKFDRVVLPNVWPRKNRIVLENLRTLADIINFGCGEEILAKISNITKLSISYNSDSDQFPYHLRNLVGFKKLESICCFGLNRDVFIQNFAFPRSLKKLKLFGCRLLWEDMTMIGSLPRLEVLKLISSFEGPEWNPVEGEFSCLKFLLVRSCHDLLRWNADRCHFPRLESLVLESLPNLEEVPLDIGEIPTLRSIRLKYCSESVVVSVKNIVEEQESFGNVFLEVKILDSLFG
ncbi:putative late blight resistance protein homolog R1A-10 [Andrographis paniculata]|uniref:putative late blight resistance protein homolog R1A-10 n=1 Tax=Andrographis paniculata TaxID=175694 RepID=UPI0021E8B17A|nr:putative late blight resistance protein homolog R1A-10 [Andrographis paniculata]